MRRIKYYIIKILMSFASILFVMNLSAQHTMLNGDTLILNKEAKFWINEVIAFGSGTMPDRSYSYIYEAPNGLQKLVNNHKRKLLSPSYRGYKSKIVKFEKDVGHNKKGYDYTILVLELPNGTKYWCDVRNAYSNHEIVLNMADNNGAQLTNSDPKNNASDLPKTKPAPKKKPAKSKETTIF